MVDWNKENEEGWSIKDVLFVWGLVLVIGGILAIGLGIINI